MLNKLRSIKEIYKILISYFIITISTMILSNVVIKHDFILSEKKKYMWVIVLFSLIFVILIKIFAIKFKSIIIFFSIIMSALIVLIINVDFFISFASTPEPIKLFRLWTIAIVITMPFITIFETLVGYEIGNLSFILVPLYILIMILLSYLATYQKKNSNKKI